nr:random slug protein 5-like [Ipomoea batatas]
MFRRRNNSHHEQGPDEQLQKVNELRTSLGPLSGRSLQYCSDACLKRYLVARSWNVDKAKKMLEETLKWRSTFKPEEIRWVRGKHSAFCVGLRASYTHYSLYWLVFP